MWWVFRVVHVEDELRGDKLYCCLEPGDAQIWGTKLSFPEMPAKIGLAEAPCHCLLVWHTRYYYNICFSARE